MIIRKEIKEGKPVCTNKSERYRTCQWEETGGDGYVTDYNRQCGGIAGVGTDDRGGYGLVPKFCSECGGKITVIRKA